MFQPPLPPEYRDLDESELIERIAARKAKLSRRIVILGHHYQADDVVRFADFTGDSFKLARQAAEQAGDAEFIVFCGVHFMAESADILARPHQKVILPDLSAGCSMADMADVDQVQEAWDTILSAHEPRAEARGHAAPGSTTPPLVPICYMNSTAAIKAFCGRNGGIVCTSSDAARAIKWALEKAGAPAKVLFIPDQHLGRNTAFALGFPLDSMAVWDPNQVGGGLTGEQIRKAAFILWNGHCSVHQLFTPGQIDQVRSDQPGIRVIVHPECTFEVVQKADQSGSTEQIIAAVEQSPPGTSWAVGTEVHLVKRLADRLAGVKHVRSLGQCQCLCTTMYRIDPPHLLWSLDNLAAGQVVNRITVDDETKRWAKVALDRMLSL